MLPTESVDQGYDLGYAAAVTFCNVYVNERGPEMRLQCSLYRSLMFH